MDKNRIRDFLLLMGVGTLCLLAGIGLGYALTPWCVA